ncbi:MAG TPA: HDIG domain-containing protein [Longimicrobiales bacterium]|nr:HDIG domain-containing protein [Longimicrobiales bacterium]
MKQPQRASRFFDHLSTTPDQPWPGGVMHHGARVLLLVGLVLLFQLLFPVSPVPDFPSLEKGMVPAEDIIADVGFSIPKSESDLEQEREAVAAAVAPVYRYDPGATDSMLLRVRTFAVHMDSAAARGGSGSGVRAALSQLLISYGFPVSDEALDLLEHEENRRLLERSLQRVITNELPAGIVASSDDSATPQWRIVRDGSEQLVARDSVATQARLFERASDYLPAGAPSGLADFQRLVLILFFEGSIRLDREATTRAREQARAAVPEVKGQVLPRQRIVAAHEPVGDAELERLNAYITHLRQSGALGTGGATTARELGTFLLNLLLLSIFGFLLYFYRRAIYGNFRHILLLGALITLLALAAAAIANTAAPVELVPIAFPALVVAALWDGRLALNMVLVLAVLLGVQTPFLNITPRMLLLLGGGAAALSVRVVRRRSQGLMLGGIIALVYALTAIALGLMRNRELAEVMNGILWGTANGIATALLAMGFMPLFESFTRITTDQTLLELADLNRPLLKRLSLEASGTYAHSINVANLAEAAARAIDANPLLARVGAYYHDVGKIALPQYFIENQVRGRNPHDQLDPRRSAEIVRQHVIEGMKLAEQAKLPESVRRFIPEHHGTQPIAYFLDRARQAVPEAELDPAEFSYPGPRPQMKETAILMLADSVESAAKVLQDPTAERIRALVDRIVQGKIDQHQLDETPLTLAEISRIKEQFAVVLTGMYHHRIDYPPAPPPPARPTPPASAGSGSRS